MEALLSISLALFYDGSMAFICYKSFVCLNKAVACAASFEIRRMVLKKETFFISILPLSVSKKSNLHGLTTFINSFISTPQ